MRKIITTLLPYKTKITAWWLHLNSQQRTYLSILIIFLIIFGGYYLIILPVNNAVVDLQNQINYQQSILQKIRPQVTDILQLKSVTTNTTQISANNLLTTVDQNLKSQGLGVFAGEISQADNNGVQIKFANVPFDQLINWLINLWQNYHIQVIRIDVQHTDKPGNVNVLVTLSN